jgi:hypothetical protein
MGDIYSTRGRDEKCIEYSSLEASSKETLSEIYITSKMGS